MLDRETEFGLCALIGRGGGGADSKRYLGHFCEVHREKFDELIINFVGTDSIAVGFGEDVCKALA